MPDKSVAVDEKSQAVIFRIPIPLLHKIDALERDGCLSRSERMRRLLAAGLKAEEARHG